MGIDTGLGTLLGVPKPVATSPVLERETGIEPASLAWKAKVLPLNYSRSGASPRRSCERRRARKLEAKEPVVVVVEEAGFEPA